VHAGRPGRDVEHRLEHRYHNKLLRAVGRAIMIGLELRDEHTCVLGCQFALPMLVPERRGHPTRTSYETTAVASERIRS
jgi:hypothetical protein